MSALVAASGTFDECYQKLLALPPPLLQPSKPSDASLSDTIASLYMHPAIEIALHILNNDLVSAHFLVRHMEAPPAYEAMFLHGILHRIEGDFDNARAWYKDVSDTEIFRSTWPSKENALQFINEIEAYVKTKEGTKFDLETRSLEEIKRVVEFLASRFGTDRWQNAQTEWHYAEGQAKEVKDQMILGQEGHRQF